jgi:hypothetical protein
MGVIFDSRLPEAVLIFGCGVVVFPLAGISCRNASRGVMRKVVKFQAFAE